MFQSFIIIYIVTSPALSFTIGYNRTLNETATICGEDQFKCGDGSCISVVNVCDKLVHCSDASDEFVCATVILPNDRENCILPPYPDNGSYTMEGNSAAIPGDVYDQAFLNVICNPGFSLNSQRSFAYCVKGLGWLDPMAKCVIPTCRLPKQRSVEYRCTTDEGTRECYINVPNGTVVQPVCRKPNYKFPGNLPDMHCINGVWNYLARCIPNRKITTTINSFLQITVTTANKNIRVNMKPGKLNLSIKLNIPNIANANNTANEININNSTVLPVNTNNTDKANDDLNSNLDESFWRIGDGVLR